MFSLQFIDAGLQIANTFTIAHNAYYITINPHAPPMCNDPFVATVKSGLETIIGVLRSLGVAAAVHSIVMGGLIRMLSFGNERKIAESNAAILSGIIGLIVILLSVVLGNDIPNWFGLANHTCLIGPEGSSIPQ